MNTSIKVYNNIVSKVRFFFTHLKLNIRKSTGRPLAIDPCDTIALLLFKQAEGIETKKAVFDIFALTCTYKTFVVNAKNLFVYALLILKTILRRQRETAHVVKHTDSTDIPVCLNKNARHHKTMGTFASWGHSGKGFYYGLKLSITTDLHRSLLAFRFGSGNSNDRETFKEMNKDLMGIFVADAGYISKDLEREFFIEHKRLLLAKPKANMKRLATAFQTALYDTRMQIEINFRNLKMFYNLVTSLPRSIDGYIGNYIYALLAYVLR
jgi:hypothetical protein